MTREELALALERAKLLRSADAARGVRAGWEMESWEVGPYQGLDSVYSVRADHLRTFAPTAHIIQLVDSMEEFVRNLRNGTGGAGRWIIVTGQGEEDHDYSIFCSENGEILGCMGTLNPSRLSPKRSAELCPELEKRYDWKW